MLNEPLTDQEKQAILRVCVLAAFADGDQAEIERAQVQRIVEGFPDTLPDSPSAYQDVLSGKSSLGQVAEQLQRAPAKALAYEMAVCVCQADSVLKESEKQFLADLSKTLQLSQTAT